jgi:hypothetical protein
MAEDGVVGQYNGAQARDVLLSLEEWEARNRGDSSSAPASPGSNAASRGVTGRESDPARQRSGQVAAAEALAQPRRRNKIVPDPDEPSELDEEDDEEELEDVGEASAAGSEDDDDDYEDADELHDEETDDEEWDDEDDEELSEEDEWEEEDEREDPDEEFDDEEELAADEDDDVEDPIDEEEEIQPIRPVSRRRASSRTSRRTTAR